MAVTGPLGAWLVARALAAGAGFSAGPGAVGGGDLATVVSVVLLWAGCVAAAWYFVTCAAVVVVLLARAAGTGAAGLERAVRRWGFPLLRRTVLSTVAAGASLSLSVGAAGAAQSAHEAPLPQDLGWGASTVSTQPPVGAAVGAEMRAAILPLAGGPAGAEAGSADTTPPTEGAGATTPAPAEPSAHAGVDTPPPPAGTGRIDGGRLTPARTSPADAVPRTVDVTGAAQGPASSPAAARSSAPPTTATATARDAIATRATATGTQGRSAGERGTTYLVQPGDSLWSIAASHLSPDAADAEVAQAWPRWYAANRPDLGPDPHLIHPGKLLQIPNEEAS